jgi:hypothetical protein
VAKALQEMSNTPRNKQALQRLFQKRMTSKGRAFARLIMRIRLPFVEAERVKVLTETLEEIAKQASKARHYGYGDSLTFLNAALFFLIAERDIQCAKIDTLTHPDRWRRSLNARIILLTIHELDMDKVAGTRLRKAMENLSMPSQLIEKTTQSLRNLRAVQKKARSNFAFLRNATIAHRDPDALLQYRAICAIDELAVIRIAMEFYDAVGQFINILPDLILSANSIPSLLHQKRR